MSSSAIVHQHHLSDLVALLANANQKQAELAPTERTEAPVDANVASTGLRQALPGPVGADGHLPCFTTPGAPGTRVADVDAAAHDVRFNSAPYASGAPVLPGYVVGVNQVSHTSEPASRGMASTACTSTLQDFKDTSAVTEQRVDEVSIEDSQFPWKTQHFENNAMASNPEFASESIAFQGTSHGEAAGVVPLVETFEVSNDPYSSPSGNILVEPISSCTDAASHEREDMNVASFHNSLGDGFFRPQGTTAHQTTPSLVHPLAGVAPEGHMAPDLLLNDQSESRTKSSSSSSPQVALGVMELSDLDTIMAGKRKFEHVTDLTCESAPARKRPCPEAYPGTGASPDPFISASDNQLASAHVLQTRIDSAVASAARWAPSPASTPVTGSMSSPVGGQKSAELVAGPDRMVSAAPTTGTCQYPLSGSVADPTSIIAHEGRHAAAPMPTPHRARLCRAGNEVCQVAVGRDGLRSELVSSTSERMSANADPGPSPCLPDPTNGSLSNSASSQRAVTTTSSSPSLPPASHDVTLNDRSTVVPRSRGGQEENAKGGSRLRAGRAGVPSKFCHVCTARTAGGAAAICAGVPLGTCRKTVCRSCFVRYEHNFQWEAVAGRGGHGWDCFHCRSRCPSAAQCKSYERVNEKRRRRLLKMKLDACGAEKRQDGQERTPPTERQGPIVPVPLPGADAFDRAALVASQQRSLHFTALMAQRLEARQAYST